MFNDLVSYGLASVSDLVEISTMSEIGNGARREIKTYRMSYNVFKHYISSSQTERGYRTRAKLHQAEEELLAIKADPLSILMPALSEALKPIVGAIETVATGLNSLAGVVGAMQNRLETLEAQVNRPQLEVRKPIHLILGNNNVTTTLCAQYVAAYGMRPFGLMVAAAYRQHFGREPHRWGKSKASVCAYSEQEFTALWPVLKEKITDANVRMHRRYKKLRNTNKPAEGQQSFLDGN